MKREHNNFKKNYNGKVIFITGGSGFIGNHLIKALTKYECKIHIFDKRIKKKRNILGKLFWHSGDIRNLKNLRKIIDKVKPNFIFHLAALLNPSRDLNLIEGMITTNFIGTLNLLTAIKNIKFERLIFMGTCEEYGLGQTPFKESQSAFPVSPYSLSKIAATNLCLFYSKVFNYPIVVLRPTLVYGPGQKAIMFIPSLIKALIKNKGFGMTKGKQKRDFIYIDDLIGAILKAGLKKKAIGEVINIGSGKSYPLKEVVGRVKKIIKSKSQISFNLPYRPLEIMNYSADISKAKKILNWKPSRSLERGLEETINYYKSEI